ncbi:glycine N-acyltransferase-like [Glandiceps talaboti]
MARLVTSSEIPSLLKTLEKWNPECLPIYQLLENSYENNNTWPCISIYVDCKDVDQMTTILCCCGDYHTNPNGNNYFLYSVDDEKMNVFLAENSVIDWSRKYVQFEIMSLAYSNMVEEIALQHSSSLHKPTGVYHYYTCIGDDRVEEITNRSLPCGFTLAPLRIEHAPLLISKFSYPGIPPVTQFAKLIECMPTLAVYNEKGTPVSWAVIKEYGEIGMTYTEPGYRRQGFASIVTANLVKIQQERGEIPYTIINEHKEASANMHTRLGFVKQPNTESSYFFFLREDSMN